MGGVLHNNQVLAVMIGGGFLLLAVVLVQFVREAPVSAEQLALIPPETPLG